MQFKKTVLEFYRYKKRIFPWRETSNPYFILVSEIMLQQTQAPRVIEKYREFIEKFPTIQSLAKSSNTQVLATWQGLGYNRRALYLKQIANTLVENYSGRVPREIDELTKLPGIGYNTACAIVAFAFNSPTVFIETNIRTVFIHFFFKDSPTVSDKDILPLVEETLDRNNPRDWYYALMDYGTFLKKEFKNPSRKSKTYAKQAPFEGSNRQLRGKILKLLLENKHLSQEEINNQLPLESTRIEKVLKDLEKEQFINKSNSVYTIA